MSEGKLGAGSLGFESPGGTPIHVVIEASEHECVVKTVYEPHPDDWHEDWMTRR